MWAQVKNSKKNNRKSLQLEDQARPITRSARKEQFAMDGETRGGLVMLGGAMFRVRILNGKGEGTKEGGREKQKGEATICGISFSFFFFVVVQCCC